MAKHQYLIESLQMTQAEWDACNLNSQFGTVPCPIKDACSFMQRVQARLTVLGNLDWELVSLYMIDRPVKFQDFQRGVPCANAVFMK